MDNSTVFTPVRGYDRNIQTMDYQDGFLYFVLFEESAFGLCWDVLIDFLFVSIQ